MIINDPENPEEFQNLAKGKVEFRDVSFRYPDAQENVLCHINFTASPGKQPRLSDRPVPENLRWSI